MRRAVGCGAGAAAQGGDCDRDGGDGLLRGEATQIAREAYGRGYRKFLAVGGDGTSYEIVNGLFPECSSQLVSYQLSGNIALAEDQDPDTWISSAGNRQFVSAGFRGSGFRQDGLEHAMQAMEARRSRPCDVLRLAHKDGAIYYINLLSVGFAADVAALRHRRFRGWGRLDICCRFFFVWRG